MSSEKDVNLAAALNRQAWDSIRRQRDEGMIANHHDVASEILAGRTKLKPKHWELAGMVSGKRLLDLGCGDGGEMLEWARAGADVVGVDNSPNQLAAAQRAFDTLGLQCRLVQGDLLDLPNDLLEASFDIVFSSWVTAWIGDLPRWFRAVRQAMKPGGIFLLGGGHPLVSFAGEQKQHGATRQSYFQEGPFVEQSSSSSVWNPAGDNYVTIQWQPMLGSLVTAIAEADLRITHLFELGDASAKFGLEGYPEEFLVRAVRDQ